MLPCVTYMIQFAKYDDVVHLYRRFGRFDVTLAWDRIVFVTREKNMQLLVIFIRLNICT